MGHHSKVKKGNAAGGRNLLDHDKRRVGQGRSRSNKDIDPERTHLNRDYSIKEMDSARAWEYAEKVAQEHSKRKVRDDMVIMSCEVMHLPKNWPSDRDPAEFFEKVALPFYRERYGVEDLGNEISAVVHYDEKTPHLHYKYVPITKDGRLSHKQVNGMTDLKTFHPDLVAFAEKQGFPGLDLYDEERASGRDRAPEMPEYKEAMKAINEKKQEIEELTRRLESHRQRETELLAKEEAEEIVLESRDDSELDSRIEELDSRVGELREQLSERKRVIEQAKVFEGERPGLERRIGELEDAIGEIKRIIKGHPVFKRLESLKARIKEIRFFGNIQEFAMSAQHEELDGDIKVGRDRPIERRGGNAVKVEKMKPKPQRNRKRSR